MLPILLALVVNGAPVPVPCQTVADCWLDGAGEAIKRPAKQRGRSIPRGDCGKNLVWLRNILSCEAKVCVSQHVGDRC